MLSNASYLLHIFGCIAACLLVILLLFGLMSFVTCSLFFDCTYIYISTSVLVDIVFGSISLFGLRTAACNSINKPLWFASGRLVYHQYVHAITRTFSMFKLQHFLSV